MQYVNVKGANIPALGLGTWRLKGAEALRITGQALELGYRHLDTAQMYDNEAEVGQAVASSTIDRDQLFITTKVWWENLPVDKFRRSVENSLANLRLDAVDLLLIHWPHPTLAVESYLEDLMRVQEQGLARFIGISNFTPSLIEKAAATGADLINNQVEYHPLLDQTKTLDACRRFGLSLTAYCPLAQGAIVTNSTLKNIAENHEKTVAQVALRWLIQQPDVLAIPKTSNPLRLQENLGIFDFELSAKEMQEIFSMTSPRGRLVSPSFGPQWEL